MLVVFCREDWSLHLLRARRFANLGMFQALLRVLAYAHEIQHVSQVIFSGDTTEIKREKFWSHGT